MTRWHATIQPQHTLPADGVRASGTSSFERYNASKPDQREAPPSA